MAGQPLVSWKQTSPVTQDLHEVALKQDRLCNLQGLGQDESLEVHRGDSRAFREAQGHSLHTPEAWSGEGVRGEQLVCGIGPSLVTLLSGRGGLSFINR